MQKIKIKEDLIKIIKNGKKRATVRLGIKPYTLGQFCFIRLSGDKAFEGADQFKITQITEQKWDNIRTDHSLAQKEGYNLAGELANALIDIYGEDFEGDVFTVIHFEPL